MSDCNLTMEGKLGKDPELKYSQAGNLMANFSLAFNPINKGKKGEAVWFNFTAVGTDAKHFESLAKGDLVKVTKAIPNPWKDKEGNQRISWTVFAVDVDILPVIDVGADLANGEEPPFQDDDVPF